MPEFYNEQLLVGGIESTFRTPGAVDLMLDTFDVGQVTLTPDITRLTRNNNRPTMTPLASKVGRRRQSWSFPMDIAGTGLTDGSAPPRWGKFLRMCGMAQTAYIAPTIAVARANPGNAKKGVVAAAHGTSAYTGTLPRVIVVTVTAAAQVSVYSQDLPNGDPVYNQTNVAVTSATAFDGPQGTKLQLTFTAPLVVGDSYFFLAVPRGHLYTPVADPDSVESGYLYHYTASKRHLMAGVRGTFSIAATAGEIASATFNMTGDYANPTDLAFPNPGTYSYGNAPEPAMVELADVSLNGRTLACPTTFGVNLQGNVAARLCANAAGANDGSMLLSRAPTATFNMDSVPVATMNVWQQMIAGTQLLMHGYIGQSPGNCVMLLANGQITAAPYANLESMRKNDVTLTLCGTDTSVGSNDELMIFVG